MALPDKDQTGMRLYTLDGTLITGAWGQDPATAGPAKPFLDVGNTIPNFPVPVIRKTAVLVGTDSGPAGPSIGDTMEYTLTLENKGLIALSAIPIIDAPPASGLDYVAGSTSRDGIAIPDDSNPGTPFPLDDNGVHDGIDDGLVVPIIQRGEKTVITYRMTITSAGTLTNVVTSDLPGVSAKYDLVVPAAVTAQCTIDYTSSSGTAGINYEPGAGIYVTLTDADANTNSGTAQTLTVVVKNDTNGDVEEITLTETGVDTGVFRNASALPSSTTAGGLVADGTLRAVLGDSLSVSYTDPLYGDTCAGAATITPPTKIKPLYLTPDAADGDTTGALDRIDPANVVPTDSTTSNTAILGGSGTNTIQISGAKTSGTTIQGSSLSFSHSTGSGSDRLLLVGVSLECAGASCSSTADPTVSTVTFGGTALTRLGRGFANSNDSQVEIWYLKNPAINTTANVVVTLGGTTTTQDFGAGAITLANVDQAQSLSGVFATGNGTAASTSITPTTGQWVFDTVSWDNAQNTQTPGTNQTSQWTFSTGTGTGNTIIAGAASTKSVIGAPNSMSWTGSASSNWAMGAVAISPSSSVGNTTATFTQTPTMATNLNVVAGGTVSASVFIDVTSGTFVNPPNIDVAIAVGATTIANLTGQPTVTTIDAGNGIYRLDYTGSASAATVAAGQAVVATLTTNESGFAFQVLYDSSTYPSKITLPTVDVITVDSLAVYDAPYPGGSPVTSAVNGQILYVRATVSDPFGAADITSLPLDIYAPGETLDGTGGLADVTLDNAYVVASTASSKTYEYVWNSPATEGAYTVAVEAKEGFENTVSDQKSTTVNLGPLDLGTPVAVEFTNGDNGPGTETYNGGQLVCLRITDLDLNNPAVTQTITATIVSSSGDSEQVTLTETGANTGVFTACIPASTTGGTTPDDSTLNVPTGSVLNVVYTDPNDPTDSASDTATVPPATPTTSVAVAKALISPTDGQIIVGEAAQFRIRVTNTGTINLDTVALTDTYKHASLDYTSASPAPDTVDEGSGTLSWTDLTGTGSLASGETIEVMVSFVGLAADASATNSASVSGTASSGPATADVIITNPKLTVAKTRTTPPSGDLNKGDSQTYQIVVTNTGDTAIATLPLEDTFSAACFSYVSAIAAPDSTSAGSLLWTDITGGGSLAVGGSQTITVTLKAEGGCDPGNNLATVNYAVDANGDAVPPANDNEGVKSLAASISGFVYEDEGAAGFGEDTPLAGVAVTLYTDPNGDGNPADGTVAGVTTTNALGYYEFLNLGIGKYVVVEADPFGYVSIDDTGGADTDNRVPVDVTTLTSYPGNNFLDDTGEFGAITGKVINDSDGSGTENSGDSVINNVTITLYTDPNGDGNPADGVAIRTTTTAADGTYRFDFVPAGNYVVVETDPTGYVSTGDKTLPNDNRIPVVRTGTTDSTGNDFLDTNNTGALVSVSGTVIDDANGSGTKDGAEGGLSGVTLALVVDTNDNGLADPGEPTFATTTSAANGTYSFTNLPKDKYVVVETDPAGYVSTADAVGDNDNQVVADASLASVTGRDFLDAPDSLMADISGQVRNDLDGDGDLSDSEPGISSVTVKLYRDDNGNGVYDSGTDTQVATTTTNADGNYSFTDLPLGPYLVVETDPSGAISTGDKDGATNGPNTIAVNLTGAGSTDNDFLDRQVGTLGNRVWLDENGDGVQDAGEGGIPNLTVKLFAKDADPATDTPLQTTVTDADGGYLFKVAPGDYLVAVTPATGLQPTFDEDGTGNADLINGISVAVGEEHLTADFGYNWVSPTDSANPPAGATGTIGDRIWNDANGDGVQDPGEAGIGNVTVNLYADSDGNGSYTDLVDSTTTAADGSYIFDGLDAGAYKVVVTPPAGYTQTGDPDATKDNQTTDPIVLAPGDVYVNADFGYRLPTSGAGAGHAIGDRIFLDANGNGADDGTDPGIPGVTVALLDSTGQVIATDITDANGLYRFPGLPAGDYTVRITDTGNILGDWVLSVDPEGAVDGQSQVTLDGVSDNLDQDFGYVPTPDHGGSDGFIGDTVFLDTGNGAGGTADGVYQPGEGLEGVVVELYDSTGLLLATIVTNENGQYAFGGLDPDATYVVKVDATTLPNSGAGLTNTVDPDTANPGDSQSSITLTDANPVNLAQDFGYKADAPNTLGGTVWEDRNADGTLTNGTGGSANETGNGLIGISVVLYEDLNDNGVLDNDEPLVARTVTDASGNYRFPGLPDGDYLVQVTDEDGLLGGYWKSDGHSAGTDNNSQIDPYAVQGLGEGQSSGVTNTTADFGFYRDGAALGNRAWLDNAIYNGLQDFGETAVAGVKVTLTITYPNSDTSTVVTVTDAKGAYTFGNLLLDESFAGSTVGEPTTTGLPRYVISAETAPTGYVAGGILDAGSDDKTDSDAHAGVTAAALVRGATDTTVNAANPSAETDNAAYDFAYLPSGDVYSLSGTIYNDTDGDGDLAERGSESALAGPSITVTLYLDDGTGNPGAQVGSPVVTSDGTYSFANVPPGDYVIVETNPTGYTSTNDVTAPNNDRVLVTVADANVTGQDFLDSQNPNLASLSGRVLDDTVGTGLLTGRDSYTGLADVTVKLYLDANANGLPESGELYGTTTTVGTGAGQGDYRFDNLPVGAYIVVETNPAGYVSTNDVGAPNDDQIRKTLVAGENAIEQDFLDSRNATLGSIAGSVREDPVGNGNFADAGPGGLDGALITLYADANGNGLPEAGEEYDSLTTSGGTGAYSFTDLPLGRYLVVETNPSGYTSTYDVSAPNDDQIPVELTVGTPDVTGRDFLDATDANARVAPISGRVIDDQDGDGALGERGTEPGIGGVVVQLYSDPNSDGDPSDGVLYDTVLTNLDGTYRFPNVPPGDYIVVETDPAGYTSTNDVVGPNDNWVPVIRGENASPVVDADFLDSQNPNLAAIGNRVWLDENSDGIEDAGEAGLANVTVELYASGAVPGTNTPLATTVTDANGGYLFTGVPAGGYSAYVVPASLATGLLPIADEDDPVGGGGAGTLHRSAVTVVGGQSYLTADFAYNYASTDDVQSPAQGATGAIGDRIWNDADGDGVQDPGEAGIGNVTVRLLTDDNGDGIYGGAGDNAPVTTTTTADGRYIFDDRLAGAYVIAVDSTSLPIGFNTVPSGFPAGGADGTSDPILLAPGDVYVNADFGYKLDTDSNPSTPKDAAGGSTIGDTIYLDVNRNGTEDADEPGIPGVSVALVSDTNGNGLADAGEPVIATDVTDATGAYRFPGLPAGNYVVLVTDADNVLGEYVPSGDPDEQPGVCVTCDSESGVTVDGTTDDRAQDFGYTAPSQGEGDERGSIGDTVFLDGNGNDAYDGGEGLQGVTVQLFASNGTTLIASTVTDANGNYLFTGLDSGRTYVVKVDTSTLPGGGANLTNSVDPDLGAGVPGDSESSRDLSLAAAGVDLAADVGYRPLESEGDNAPNRIGGTIWNDANADGTLTDGTGGTPDETAAGLPGVTVDLYEDLNNNGVLDAGDRLVGSTVTDANGDYRFANLPDGNYLVDVTDEDGLLNGYWHSDGPDDGADNNSQNDPYAVSVIAGVNNITADFGYFIDGAALGNRAWDDTSGANTANGIQDADESGVPGVQVTLLVTYPNGDTSTVVTTTAADGSYQFANLLLDERYAASTAGTPSADGLPSYTLRAATTPAGFVAGGILGAGDGKNDADDPAGVTAAPIARGDTDVTLIPANPSSEADAGAYDFAYLNDANVYSLSGTIFDDSDGDGDLSDRNSVGGSEGPLTGQSITVTLFTDDGTGNPGVQVGSPIVTTDGTYSFVNVPPGNYVIVETNPTGYTSTNDVTAPNDDRILVTIVDANVTGQDFLDSQHPNLASLSGRVLDDTVGTGLLTGRDSYTGLVGVTVELYLDANGDGVPESGELYGTTTTVGTGVGEGDYRFDNLPVGAYIVVETTPAGYVSTNDVDAPNNDQIRKTLVAGENAIEQDFLDSQNAKNGAISGQVRNDLDGDGDLNEVGDTSIPNVTVTLFTDPNGDGDPGDGTPYDTTVTDANGIYGFTGVPPGTYVIVETDPANFLSTNDLVAPNDNWIPVTLPNNGTVIDQDFLDADATVFGTISGHLYIDTNGDGVQGSGEPDLANVDVVITRSDNSTLTVTTDANGDWIATVPAGSTTANVDETDPDFPAGYVRTEGSNPTTLSATAGGNTDFGNDGYAPTWEIGDRVWHDTDRDGIQDPDEPGIFNVTVSLSGTDNQGKPVTRSTVTDGAGNYVFADLQPGTYTVTFTAPDGYSFTSRDATGNLAMLADSFDSDADLTTGEAPAVVLTGDVETLDAGLYLANGDDPARIADRVWYDTNNNGIQDADEPGVAGAVVDLWTGGASSTKIGETVTDGNGLYEFTGLPAGSYVVKFVAPDGYRYSPQDGGSPDDDTLDSDADPTTGRTDDIVLMAGADRSDIDAGLSVDGQSQPGIIGDLVWYDTNGDGIQDDDEPGIPGVEVNLYDADSGDLIARTRTDANGVYQFAGLKLGNYLVEFQAPAGYSFSDQDQGNDDSVDSDAETVTGFTGTITLAEGSEVNDSVDAGMSNPGQDDPILLGDFVWLDANGDQKPNDGEWLDGVDVVLYDALGNELARVTSSQSTAQANYQFTGLVAGDYRIAIDTSTLPLVVQIADPDATLDHESELLGVTDEEPDNNLEYDFGYEPAIIALTLDKRVYKGHTDSAGANCASEGTNELLIVSDEQTSQDITWCFTIVNTGNQYLTDPVLVDGPLGFTDPGAELPTSVIKQVSGVLPLAPGATAIFYFEEERDISLVNTASISMTPSDANGDPTGEQPVSAADELGATLAYVFDPPYGVKTGELVGGQNVVEWNMVWINTSPIMANDVVIIDQIPAGMTYLSGPICTPQGLETSYTECRFDVGNNQVYVVADIAADYPAKTIEEASNALVISFRVTIDNPTISQSFINQAEATWDPDGEGGEEDPVTGVTDDDDGTPGGSDPTPIEFNPPVPIPTLSEWAMILLILMLMGMVWRSRSRFGVNR